jgi:hypothetical protein
MNKAPTWTLPVDRETLHVLAWFSSLDLLAAFKLAQQKQSWRHPHYVLEQIVRVRLDEALVCVQGDPLFGPLLEQLVRYRIARLDLSNIAAAISFEEYVEPSFGLYFSDQPYSSSSVDEKSAVGPANETEVFSEGAKSNPCLASHLQQWAGSWTADVCCGARALQAFFAAYPRFSLSLLDAPSFVHELLQKGLANIEWHRVAAQVLDVEIPVCQCPSPTPPSDPVAQTILFRQALKLACCRIEDLLPGLPEPQREQALFLADMCRHTTMTIGEKLPEKSLRKGA